MPRRRRGIPASRNAFDAAFGERFRQKYGCDPIIDVSGAGTDPDELLKPVLAGRRGQRSVWPILATDSTGVGGSRKTRDNDVYDDPTLFDVLVEVVFVVGRCVCGDEGQLFLESFEVGCHGGGALLRRGRDRHQGRGLLCGGLRRRAARARCVVAHGSSVNLKLRRLPRPADSLQQRLTMQEGSHG